MKTILLLIFGLSHPFAFATPECDWAIQVSKDSDYRIDRNNRQIGSLNSLLSQQNETIRKELKPQRDELAHTVSVYDLKSRTSTAAQLSVGEAMSLLQSMMTSNEKLKLAFDRLSAMGSITQNLGLAQQLSEALPKIKTDRETRASLEQLIHSVRLLETLQVDWQDREKEILETVLSGKVGLSNALIERLRSLDAELTSDLQQLDAAKNEDQQRFQQSDAALTDANKKVASYQQQIADLNKANAAQVAQREKWAVGRWCPREERSMPRFSQVGF